MPLMSTRNSLNLMKGCKMTKAALLLSVLLILLAGCANLPLREGGLAVDKDTTAGIEDLGVASINRQF